jgi:hypothetical protein
LQGVLKLAAKAYSRSNEESPVFAEAEAEGKKFRLQIVGTTGIVFVAFLLRSAYSTFCAPSPSIDKILPEYALQPRTVATAHATMSTISFKLG